MYHQSQTIPEVGELDKLETFVGLKSGESFQFVDRSKGMLAKTKQNLVMEAVDYFSQGILAIVLGDHSAETFQPLWNIISLWQSYFYVTDGWKVYASFIEPEDHIISKTYMTIVFRAAFTFGKRRKHAFTPLSRTPT